MYRTLLLLLTVIATAFCVTGCTLKYTIDEPVPSRFTYQNVDQKPISMNVVDEREDKLFSPGISGLKKVGIVFENIDDPVGWLAKALQKEFAAHGVPLQLASKDAAAPADLTLVVTKYQVVNHRASGFSAWESYHLFLGQVTMGDKSCSIPAFFFNSKVPVWSMDEINKPCLSTPMSAMVKEIAAKINRCVFNYTVSDADLEKMAAEALAQVKPETDTACLPAIALGATNNLTALPTLQKLAEYEDSEIHNCAVSAIGTLGTPGQYDYLVGKFRTFTNNDKVMPLKALGDSDSSQARAFISQVKGSELYNDENSVKYCVDLYLAK